MQRSRRRLAVIALIVLLAAVSAACGKEASVDREAMGDAQKIIAVYEGGEVNEQEFNVYYYVDKYFYEEMHQYYEQGDPEGFREQMLQRYISFKILSGRAGEDIVDSTASEVDQRMSLFDEELNNDEGAKTKWQARSSQWGITKEDIKQYILVQATALNYIRSQVTDEQVQSLYEQTLEQDPHAYTIATVRQVLVAFEPESGDVRTNEEALARALDVKEMLDNGQDFAEVAQQYSDDGGSRSSGGRYVSVMVNDWVEPLREAVIELPIDAISDPVETNYGYYVIKVEDRHAQTLEEVRGMLEGQAVNEMYANFMNEELPVLIEEIDLPVSDGQVEVDEAAEGEAEAEDEAETETE